MLKKIMLAGLAAGALALNAPVASAADAEFDCSFDSLQQDDVTGQSYQGAAAGYVASPSGGTVGINCVILVNGTQVTQTGTQTGTPAAVTAADISFNATEFDDVDICADVTDHGVTTRHCFQSQHQQIPPQVVYDTIDGALAQVWPIVDPPVCSVLKLIAGNHGPVTVNSQGDIYVDGEPFWDCPPYDIDWGV